MRAGKGPRWWYAVHEETSGRLGPPAAWSVGAGGRTEGATSCRRGCVRRLCRRITQLCKGGSHSGGLHRQGAELVQFRDTVVAGCAQVVRFSGLPSSRWWVGAGCPSGRLGSVTPSPAGLHLRARLDAMAAPGRTVAQRRRISAAACRRAARPGAYAEVAELPAGSTGHAPQATCHAVPHRRTASRPVAAARPCRPSGSRRVGCLRRCCCRERKNRSVQ